MAKSTRRSLTAAFGALTGEAPSPAPPADPAPEADAGPAPEVKSGVPPSPAPSRVGAGVIGATQRTLTEIREERDRLIAMLESGEAGGLRDLDPELVDPSPFPDRLPEDGDVGFAALRETIQAEGQQLPIRVRPHPNVPGRFQVVYGHRRLRAARDLGIKVKALVGEISDAQLAIAQGLENSARQDLTFIERALFARRMEAAGVRAREIRAALSVDDPELARMRRVWRAVPEDVIHAIGRAPKIGRPRWMELARLLDGRSVSLAIVRETLSADKVSALPSDDRFRAALRSLTEPAPAAKPKPERTTLPLKDGNGLVLGRAVFAGDEIRVKIDPAYADALREALRFELPYIAERLLLPPKE